MFETRDDFYGDEDQNDTMAIIDSKTHPSEPQQLENAEHHIEQFAAEVNRLRAEITQCSLAGKDAEELILLLVKAEENLDTWIDIRVAYRKMNGEQLPY